VENDRSSVQMNFPERSQCATDSGEDPHGSAYQAILRPLYQDFGDSAYCQ